MISVSVKVKQDILHCEKSFCFSSRLINEKINEFCSCMSFEVVFHYHMNTADEILFSFKKNYCTMINMRVILNFYILIFSFTKFILNVFFFKITHIFIGDRDCCQKIRCVLLLSSVEIHSDI